MLSPSVSIHVVHWVGQKLKISFKATFVFKCLGIKKADIRRLLLELTKGIVKILQTWIHLNVSVDLFETSYLKIFIINLSDKHISSILLTLSNVQTWYIICNGTYYWVYIPYTSYIWYTVTLYPDKRIYIMWYFGYYHHLYSW